MSWEISSPTTDIYEPSDNELDESDATQFDHITTLPMAVTEDNLLESVDEILDSINVIEEKETEINDDYRGILF